MTAGPGPGGHAPALQRVEEFLNTLDERHFSLHGAPHTGGDTLASPGDLAAWLASHALIPAGTPAGPADLAMARALREALRDLLTLRTAPDTADAVTGALPCANQTLNAHLLRVQADSDGTLVLVPASHGIPAALAAIAATAALAQAAGTWQRLKICSVQAFRSARPSREHAIAEISSWPPGKRRP